MTKPRENKHILTKQPKHVAIRNETAYPSKPFRQKTDFPD